MRSGQQAAKDAGVTYRQLDYWCQMGYINAPSHGSGVPREVPDEEFRVLLWMADLVKAGLTPATAAVVGRKLAEGAKHVDLGPVRLVA